MVNNFLKNNLAILFGNVFFKIGGYIYKFLMVYLLNNYAYGILTIIGDAHLETFKTKENICKTKFELIESLPDDGACVLNLDDPYQVSYVKNSLKSKAKILWIGVDNKEALYMKDFDEIVSYIKSNAKANDIVLTLGAGTVTNIGPEIIKP